MGLLVFNCITKTQESEKRILTNFNYNWKFKKQEGVVDAKLYAYAINDTKWKNVSLPHTAHIEPLVIKEQQWLGTCWYRKNFTIAPENKEKHIALYFEGAMQVADVWLNGKKIAHHKGGYLPFYVNLTNKVFFEKENTVVVKLNNENNSQVPPGRPIENLDFNWFSGLYRNVHLIIKNKIHITNPIQADIVAGGGVFVQILNANTEESLLKIRTDILNESDTGELLKTKISIYDALQNLVASAVSQPKRVGIMETGSFSEEIIIKNPKLWSPESPSLYMIKIELLKGGNLVDEVETSFGIRTIKFDNKGFYLNGEKYNLIGTNRHQEYPYIGYALSDNAQYRDAYKIKQAGFNFVRLSHYPQAESFMNACDELGVLVMDAIPGWQFFGEETFQENCYKDIRQMVRRDRNHPSVILWEASLNESEMTEAFMEKAHAIVHEEYPGDQAYSCGWLDHAYDVFIPARQHAEAPYYWKNYDKNRPLFIAEYGDWEYYAQNAGFNQGDFSDLKENERTSRQLRGDGQKRLAQQALNYQESHNDNLYNSAAGDANWLMYDYNRGYAPDLESSGIMDIFRLPKFVYYFYSSQQALDEESPVLFIANYWNDPKFNDVKIYSNCDEVELWLNDKVIERKQPDDDRNSSNLKHPPFTFEEVPYQKGTLIAKGFVNGKQIAETSVSTPGKPAKIELTVDESGKPLETNCNDVVFIYAKILDIERNYVPTAKNKITFTVEGDVELIGGNPSIAEAGIATILLKAGKTKGKIKVFAKSENFTVQSLEVEIK
ncbi:glycoside hydrolase family 2 TIM barrel-domain containing protein [Aureibaculum sp. 2210JD6-5]|nr:glycoside hydrolase family 2 TIM barrel-domain containing protein [Aureibaculum sp. 2210JD6-5]